jgi:hypothetical protein
VSIALDYVSAARYVRHRRTPTGGYCFYREPAWSVEEPNAPDTLAAVESLRLLRCTIPQRQQTIAWLQALQDPSGGYPTLTIGWATLRSLDVLDAKPVRSPEQWVQRWGATVTTAAASRGTVAIREAARVADLTRRGYGVLGPCCQDGFAALLAATSGVHGGWVHPSADIETTAVAVCLAQIADLPASRGPRLRAFVRRCEDGVLGVRIAPSAGATSAGALWAGTKLAHALGIRLRFPDAVGANLAMLQRPDGGLGHGIGQSPRSATPGWGCARPTYCVRRRGHDCGERNAARLGLKGNAKPEQRHAITVNEHAISTYYLRAQPRPVPGVDPQIVHRSRPAGRRTRSLVAVVDGDGTRASVRTP